MRGAYRIRRQSPHSYARHTLYTHCYAYPTRATHSRIHAECTSTQYTTQTHTRRRGRTHTARVKPKNKLVAAPRDCQLRDSNPGLHRGRQPPWPLGHSPYATSGDDRRILIRPPRRKTQESVTKTQCKNFWAAPPPLAEADYTRLHSHARTPAHSHASTHTYSTQTRYTNSTLHYKQLKTRYKLNNQFTHGTKHN